MKKILAILLTVFLCATATAQVENSIVIDTKSFRAVQTDALTGVNIDPIGLDHSRQACARIKIKFDRMNKAQIDALEVKMRSNTDLTKQKVADYYDNVLILEMTAKPNTRFYFYSPEFGESNEVTLNLEDNREYEMLASLNQTFSIIVNSNVANADVYIDGVFKGKTDSSNSLTIKEVMIGGHKLKVQYGKVSSEQDIEVNDGSISFRQSVNTAANEPQFVVFTVEPQSAVVTIDGKHYTLTEGAMRAVLDGGTYNYTVSAVGYHSQSGTFTVAGSKVTKNITLSADAATVTLAVADNAEIWVNGERVGAGRWSGKLNSGAYIFEARKAGHRTTTTSKHITSAQPVQSYTLETPTPIVGSIMVDGTPINADVALDGKAVGQMPLKLSNLLVGQHKITVSKSGYQPYTTTVTIAEGKTATVSATLTKQTTQASSSSGKIYKVGDYYNDGVKEGVVFEVSADGRHGKIVSMKQSSEGLQWASDSAEQKRLIGANSTTDGAYNMAKVMAITGWREKYPAFKWCADLGEGWYLPSIDELKTFTLNDAVHDAVNRTLIARGGTKLYDRGEYCWYWSSTEDGYKCSSGEFCAWDVGMGGGSTNNNPKNSNSYVRAVSAFGNSSKSESVATTSAPYKVGDYYNENGKEGVVFEVSADGRSGKIVSRTRSTSYLQWSSDSAEQKRLIGADSETDGAVNMAKVKAISGWEAKYPAFKWCADLGEGWYLPSKKELRTIYENQDKLIPNLSVKLSGVCWSSNEYNYQYSSGEFCARGVDMTIGSTYTNRKSHHNYARAVSAFGDSSKSESVATTSAPYKVGDYYNENGKEGVVFEVSADGRHGKIVSMKQSVEGLLKWSADSAEKTRLIGANSKSNGAANMAKVKAISGWQTKYPAFKWCDDLGEGWYLPSIEELKAFTISDSVRNAVNRTLKAKGGEAIHNKGDLYKWYWSSTEHDEQYLGKVCVWRMTMLGATPEVSHKGVGYTVRAVAAF